MPNDIRKEIRFVADIDALKESLRQIGPLLREMESQLQINLPIRPSVVGADKYGNIQQPVSPYDPMGTTNQQMKQTTAYQFLQMQEMLRTRTTGMWDATGGKPVTQLVEERLSQAKLGGQRMETFALEKLLESSKSLDKRFNEATASLEGFEKQVKKLSEKDLEDASKAKKELTDVQRERRDMMRDVGMGDGTGGGGGPLAGIMSGLMRGIMGVGIGRLLQDAVALPVTRMQARAAVAGVATRDVEALQDLTNFQNVMRFTPEGRAAGATGKASGFMGGLFGGYTMAGAGVGAMVGGVPGAAIGGGIGMLIQAIRGEPQRKAAQGFEDALTALAAEKGVLGKAYTAGVSTRQTFLPTQLAFGISDQGMLGEYGSYSGIAGDVRTAAKFGVSPQESLGAFNTFGGIRGGGAALNRGGWYGQNNYMERMAIMSRGTGISMQDTAQGIAGLTGGFGDLNTQLKAYEDMMARAFSRGYDNAGLAKRQMEAITSMAMNTGGGMGARGMNAAEIGMAAATSTMGATLATPGVAMAQEEIWGGMYGARGGLGEIVNFSVANQVTSKFGLAGKMKKGRSMSDLTYMLARAKPGEVSDERFRNRLRGMTTMGEPEFNKFLSEYTAGVPEAFGNLVPGGGTIEDRLMKGFIAQGTAALPAFETAEGFRDRTSMYRSGALMVEPGAGTGAGLGAITGRAAGAQGLDIINLQRQAEESRLTLGLGPEANRMFGQVSGAIRSGATEETLTKFIANMDEMSTTIDTSIKLIGPKYEEQSRLMQLEIDKRRDLLLTMGMSPEDVANMLMSKETTQ